MSCIDSLYSVLTKLSGHRYSLYELAAWKNGLAFNKINFSKTGIPVIKISELVNGINQTTAFTQQQFCKELFIHKGDLLFSWSGNPKTSIDIFRFKLEQGWLNQHIFRVLPNVKLVSEDYLYYLMKFLKPRFIWIASNKQTTGLGHVTISDLKKISVILPSKDVQKKIVNILKPIDDLITTNEKINDNLAA